ncbi:hypothetical protein [Nocardia nova]|uniref:hypothetical protein n=1 Tax=Nocardia nova TaxID=37330 RepID=UPI0033C1B9AC
MPAANRSPLTPGYVRALGVLILLLGVAVMHTLVFSSGHATASAGAPIGSTAEFGAHPAMSARHTHDVFAAHPGTPVAATASVSPALADPGCAGCMPHGGMHACVFVLVALALALGLTVIAWIGSERLSGPGRGMRVGSRRDHPPPWTVLSLAELAILRI